MKKEKTEQPGINTAGLLALKRYEKPDSVRTEKNIQSIMREVRTTNNAPSLLIFPDKSFGWMFAQPRYGVAALFLIFLGLHLLDRPMPVQPGGPVAIIKVPDAAALAAVSTNELKEIAVPGITPQVYSALAGEPASLPEYSK